VIGRPRFHKAAATLLTCSGGRLHDLELRKRDLPDAFKRLSSRTEIPPLALSLSGNKITALDAAP
ncbi:MAG: hypothetical protein LBR12_01400, partial [Opitutaceae bacterium]|nr:hypothetical protein [Opitutaceae bacterium]